MDYIDGMRISAEQFRDDIEQWKEYSIWPMLFVLNGTQSEFGGFAKVKEINPDRLTLRITGDGTLIALDLRPLTFDDVGMGYPGRVNFGMRDREGNGWGLVGRERGKNAGFRTASLPMPIFAPATAQSPFLRFGVDTGPHR